MDQQLLESHVQFLYSLHNDIGVRSPLEEWVFALVERMGATFS